MIDLKKTISKKVQIVGNDNKVYEGVVWDYIWPDDNETEGVEAIILDYPVRSDGYKYQNPVQFNSTEIKSIKIIQ